MFGALNRSWAGAHNRQRPQVVLAATGPQEFRLDVALFTSAGDRDPAVTRAPRRVSL